MTTKLQPGDTVEFTWEANGGRGTAVQRAILIGIVAGKYFVRLLGSNMHVDLVDAWKAREQAR